MSYLVDLLFFISDSIELSQLENQSVDLNNGQVISFFNSYKVLKDKGIPFRFADDYLSKEERLRLFDKTISLYDWYTYDKSFEIFNFNGVNMLGLIDTGEFHQYIIKKLKIFLSIKNILDKELPKKIYISEIFTKSILTIINPNIEVIWIGSKKTDDLYWDKINLKFNLFFKSISLNISRKRFNRLKNLFESIVFTFTKANELDPKKKSLLFLEIDPINYFEIFKNLNDYNGQIILFNRRRPLFYNIQTINNFQKIKYKILDKNFILNSDSQMIKNNTLKYTQILDEFWKNQVSLNEIFSHDGISFWNFIKTPLLKTLHNRFHDYIEGILISKKLFEKFDIRCVISLNVVGETEKIVLNVNDNNVDSIMLEHAYANYVPEISGYDIFSMYSLFQDKIAVWGKIQKEYLIKQHKINPNRILEIGSPRHDSFFREKISLMKNTKTILITLHPISDITAMNTSSFYIRFENILSNLINIIKNQSDLNIVVKLHPSQIEHNKEIEQIILQTDSNIKIHHVTPIRELLLQSDFLINISSEGYNPSTVIFEALILKRPSMNIIVDNKIYDFQFVKDNSVLNILHDEQFEKNICNFLYNSELQKKLIINGIKHVDNYLINHGSASYNFSKILKMY